jgi:superoxide dismutase
MITRDFGSLDALVKKFSAASVGVQGSGWGVRCARSAHRALRSAYRAALRTSLLLTHPPVYALTMAVYALLSVAGV